MCPRIPSIRGSTTTNSSGTVVSNVAFSSHHRADHEQVSSGTIQGYNISTNFPSSSRSGTGENGRFIYSYLQKMALIH